MKKAVIFIAVFLFAGTNLFSQISISTDNSSPDPSAMLDVKSTTKGTLIPRMTQAQITAISGPANGLQVFCTTDSKIYIFLSSLGQWKEVSYGTAVLSPFVCGNSIFISHLASGGVAPVDKTVTYGTVSGIPGEPTKCWITSNLGASQQATSVTDGTEASAGWYWQFNRKQGYKHDGTTRTPNSAWITSITENSDWTAANDPCALELFTGWRIPTPTEWNNVVAGGSWTNYNGPWNSALKMHAAGFLHSSNGSLNYRGLNGYYRSSVQVGTSNATQIFFNSSNIYVYPDLKAHGFSIRCIRN
jgi:hypothetical protein